MTETIGHTQEFWTNFQIPHDYALGTNLELHLHVAPSTTLTTTTTGSVFQVDTWWANVNSASAITSTTVTASLANTTAWTHKVIPLVTLVGTDKRLSSVLRTHVKRLATSDARDNYGGDIHLLSVDCHYQKDKIGGDSEYSGT